MTALITLDPRLVGKECRHLTDKYIDLVMTDDERGVTINPRVEYNTTRRNLSFETYYGTLDELMLAVSNMLTELQSIKPENFLSAELDRCGESDLYYELKTETVVHDDPVQHFKTIWRQQILDYNEQQRELAQLESLKQKYGQ